MYFYVAKDQTHPIDAKYRRRNCHSESFVCKFWREQRSSWLTDIVTAVKVMIVDEHVGIAGSGNQDTQSWYHSCEVNVMIDSVVVCAEWARGLLRKQNTHMYGLVSPTDGIWRDAAGNEVEGSMGINPGPFSWAKGIAGAVQRVRGTGKF